MSAEHTVEIRVDHYSAVHLAAGTARSIALDCALPGALPDRAAVIASELASNITKHARGGSLFLQRMPQGDGMEILAADSGPGMADPERCMSDGYTTTGSLGTGLGAVRRMADEFFLRSHVPEGTLVAARLAAPGASDAVGQHLGSLVLPGTGERLSGDACAVRGTGDSRTAVVVDGLGHGAAAAEAAGCAVRSFAAAPDRPLPAVLAAMHRALRATRGAAVGALRMHAAGRIEYCGIGNIRVLVLPRHPGNTAGEAGEDRQPRQLAGQPGVVGWNMPVPRIRTLTPGPGSTVVLHTDGIDHRWYRTPPRFALRLPPPLLALRIACGERRGRDDAAVLTIRLPEKLQ